MNHRNIYGNSSTSATSIKSTVNTSTTPLTSGATYTGTFEQNDYSDVGVSCQTDNSGTLYFDFSPDGVAVNTFPVNGFTIASGIHKFHTAVKLGRYFRVRLVNDTGAQTYLRLYTYYGVFRQGNLPLNQSISSDADSTLTRAVITAEDPSGAYVNIGADLDGSLKIRNGIKSVYGEALSISYFPVVQTSHFYGIAINNQLNFTYSNGAGTATSNSDGNAVVLSIGTGVGDYIVSRSKRVIKYRHGYGCICRIGMKFQTGVASSLQFAGVGNAVSDLYFCYNGTDFGIRRSYGGLLHVVKLSISASASGTESITITLNSVAFNITLSNAGGSTTFTTHEIEIGGTGGTSYTGWEVEHIGTDVYFIGGGVGARSGTYSFVNNTGGGTASASFTTVKTGASLTTDFVAQADWNGNSTIVLDPTEYNLYEIRYTWFGTANIQYRVYNPSSGEFETVHTLRFANGQSSIYSLSNSNLYIQKGLASQGSTTSMSIESSGEFGAIMGDILIDKQPKASASNSVSISSSTETVILVTGNRLQINGFSNQSEVLLKTISVSADGNRPVLIKIIKNPDTLSADTTADYTDNVLFNTDNLLTYDTTTRTYTGGRVLRQFIVPKNGGFDSTFDNEFFLARDDIIIVTAFSTAVNTVDIAVTAISDI